MLTAMAASTAKTATTAVITTHLGTRLTSSLPWRPLGSSVGHPGEAPDPPLPSLSLG